MKDPGKGPPFGAANDQTHCRLSSIFGISINVFTYLEGYSVIQAHNYQKYLEALAWLCSKIVW